MLISSLRATALLLFLTCGLYPAVVTAIAQVAAHDAANGSLLRDERGRVIGSAHIGQAFVSPGYLQGRPSAAGAGYDASASGGSNLGMTSRKLADRRAADRERLRAENPDARGDVPEPLLAASGSGLDPELPPDAARWQIPRIAGARRVEPARVAALLDEHVVGRDFGLLGEPRVNVLAFNLALDRRFPATGARAAP
jgi:K+-transporting ATPase ATPase C chain